ncbi:rho GTPase-activating protein 6-like isoform X2 [Leptidea sinapis]|uniref:rho GTPase-activating protein 6-like isoform X2 n=1 Tax=Leptidea sinapis TaxID=189913 RepID=UPI00211FC18E|nr:rho GTPase-activating protein 6-like isoform X2 [Leptidea sinapis]
MGIQVVENSVNYSSNTCGMQKSRSSSSVVQQVSKKLWRTRSRSSSRAAASWTPQGSCCWADGSGRCVRLTDTSLLTLSEVERRALQQAALARLQQLNLGTTIKIPEDSTPAVSSKPKRRPYLLKRKALTTGFFDQSRKDADKEKESTGSVFGVPLTQCVETERALRRQLGGSRVSLASLGGIEKGDDSESCDSGDWGWSGLEEGGGGPRVPALVSTCLAHLRRHGLHTLGLFRVSSSKKRVRQLREEWERGQEAAIDAADSPHDVATLLKEFLRDLPDPLLCRDLYPAFLQTQKIRNRLLQWEALRYIVQLLPVAHRDTLNALLSFLGQLASYSSDSHNHAGHKMDAANLATIFAPNILHKNKPNEAASAEQLMERTDVINVVTQLVERQSELWTLPAELLHEAYIHLAHTQPAHLDSLLLRRAESAAASVNLENSARRVWARDNFLHSATATATATVTASANTALPSYNINNERAPVRHPRHRDAVSDTSSGSMSSAMTIVTRVLGSEECSSSGVLCSPPAPDSNDSSDYNETGGCSEDECVITASLHIPSIRPRRRSTSGSSSSAKRDSAVGSSPASPASVSSTSSPPASPPPRQQERRHDIERLVAFGRERNTSDARAVIVRQHDETTVSRATRISRTEVVKNDQTIKSEQNVRRSEQLKQTQTKRDDVRRGDHNIRREDQTARRDDEAVRRDERREGTMLYKRGELISSAQSPST